MSNRLPANLPEDWNMGDIIAPNGSDIGRTENYGYNYLNKQVNDSQTAINEITDVLGEVAQQDDLIAVKNAIGTPASTSESTVFGKLNKVKADLATVNESIANSFKRNTSAAYEYVVKKEESGLTGSKQVNVSFNMSGVVKQILLGFSNAYPKITNFTMSVDGVIIYDNIPVVSGSYNDISPLVERANGALGRFNASGSLKIGESVVSAFVENNISISFTLNASNSYGYTLGFLQERQ